ncbi:MAG: hypothetical protein CTY19_18185 [Methylomonas sp.]|nr:MAG: hypothetical protein CTY19_18185 [Methylomonas sp.]
MAKCHTCSAPLPANTQHCSYCGVRNDVDIRGKHHYRVVSRDTPCICPECDVSLETIELDIQPPLQIERCSRCFGLFFQPGEVESLLESAVSPVFEINLELIGNINNDRYRTDRPVKYLKCPECQNIMNRVAYGHRSGVVIDQCKIHGVWLDGGEITHLLEWKKAGGQILADKKLQEREQKRRRPASPGRDVDNLLERCSKPASKSEFELVESIADFIFRVFQ